MSKKVYATITTRIVMDIEEGVDPYEVINECEYNYESNTPNADIVETDILDMEITDSK